MDLYEAQDFFNKMHAGKEVKYEFDNTCLRQLEIIHTDALPHILHHVEYRKVKVIVEGQEPVYVPIAPHRGTISFADAKKYVMALDNVWISSEDVKTYKEGTEEDKQSIKSRLMEYSGLSEEKMMEKFQ